jgi:hypothetical protein
MAMPVETGDCSQMTLNASNNASTSNRSIMLFPSLDGVALYPMVN